MNAPAILTTTKLYVVFDKVAASIIGGIIQCQNDEVARRSFHDALGAKESPYAQHPQDYELLYLGTLRSDGALGDNDNLAVVGRGEDWIAANAKQIGNLKMDN